MEVFECEHRISYVGIDKTLSVSFSRLMYYVVEASLLHSEQIGFGMKWFADNSKGFLLTKWQTELYDLPKWNDLIKVKTWPTNFNGILAERTFEVYNADGTLILLANTSWVYSDTSRKRPVKIPAELITAYEPILPSKLSADFNLPTGGKLIAENIYTVLRSDIDSNGHANNLAYIVWAENSIPTYVFDKYSVSKMKTMYKKECVVGDKILIKTYSVSDDDKNILTIIYASDANVVHAAVFFEYC